MKYFGKVEDRRKSVCAVGFEPNPHHTQILAGKKIKKNILQVSIKIAESCSGVESSISNVTS